MHLFLLQLLRVIKFDHDMYVSKQRFLLSLLSSVYCILMDCIKIYSVIDIYMAWWQLNQMDKYQPFKNHKSFFVVVSTKIKPCWTVIKQKFSLPGLSAMYSWQSLDQCFFRGPKKLTSRGWGTWVMWGGKQNRIILFSVANFIASKL